MGAGSSPQHPQPTHAPATASAVAASSTAPSSTGRAGGRARRGRRSPTARSPRPHADEAAGAESSLPRPVKPATPYGTSAAARPHSLFMSHEGRIGNRGMRKAGSGKHACMGAAIGAGAEFGLCGGGRADRRVRQERCASSSRGFHPPPIPAALRRAPDRRARPGRRALRGRQGACACGRDCGSACARRAGCSAVIPGPAGRVPAARPLPRMRARHLPRGTAAPDSGTERAATHRRRLPLRPLTPGRRRRRREQRRRGSRQALRRIGVRSDRPFASACNRNYGTVRMPGQHVTRPPRSPAGRPRGGDLTSHADRSRRHGRGFK